MKSSLSISNFLEEISSLPILLFSSISLHWSLRKAFLSLPAILWNSAFKWVYLFSPLPVASLLVTAVCKVSSVQFSSCSVMSYSLQPHGLQHARPPCPLPTHRVYSNSCPHANAGDAHSIPGLGRSPGAGHGYPLQYSCLEDPHGQRRLEGYRPWGRKELDVTELT